MNLKAPAKINLCLQVLGRRGDGFHDILSLLQPLTLCDDLTIQPGHRPGIRLFCPNSPLPLDETNLALKAAQVFCKACGLEVGLELTLHKNIPIAAGLGGGSSDAAAVLKGLNQLFDQPLSSPKLAELALSLGADVPFFLQAKPAWARGAGEILEPVSLPKLYYLLINPGFAVSTAWAYERLEKPLTSPHPADTIAWPVVQSYADLAPLANDLEPVVAAAWPVIVEMRRKLLAAGAKIVRMTGSGPTIFGLFRRRDEAEKARAEVVLEDPWQIILTEGSG